MKNDHVVLYNTIYQVAGKAVTAFMGVVMTYVMTRYLGASGFGQYNFVLAFIGLAYILADFGLEPILIRTYAKKTIDAHDFNTLVTFRLIVLVALVFGSTMAAKVWFHYDNFIVTGIFIGGFANIFLILSSMIWALLKGALAYRNIVIAQILTSLAHCGLVLYAVRAGWPPIQFFTILVVGYFVGFVASLWVNPFPVRLEIDSQRLKKYLLMALPFALGVAVSIASARVNVLMLGSFYSPSVYPYVGYYSLGLRILDVIVLVGGYYGQTLYPFFSRMKDPREQSRHFSRYFAYSVLIAIAFNVAMYIASAPLVRILGDASFTPAILITRILSFAAGISIIESFFNSYLLSINKERVWVTVSVLTVCLGVALNVIFIPAYSYVAASWVTVIMRLFACVASAAVLIYFHHNRKHG
jgi:O-antigen/teichoic acid export membrane protein